MISRLECLLCPKSGPQAEPSSLKHCVDDGAVRHFSAITFLRHVRQCLLQPFQVGYFSLNAGNMIVGYGQHFAARIFVGIDQTEQPSQFSD